MSVSTYVPDSTKILHTAYADFVSRQIGRVIHVVQYDDGLPLLAVKLFSDGQPYTIPANASISIKLGKSDGTFVYNSALGCDSARHIVYFEITYQMVILAEKVSPVVEVIVGPSVAASSSISIIIDRNPIQKGSVESTSEWKMIQQSVEYAKEAISSAASASASRSAAAVSEANALAYKNAAQASAANAANSAASAVSSASQAKTSETNAKVSETNAKTSEINAKASEDKVKASETNTKISEINAANSEREARMKADDAEIYSIISKSYAIGEGDFRPDEDIDNAKYYSEQAKDAMYDAKEAEYNSDIYSLLAKSYAVGQSMAALGDGSDAFVTSDGSFIELFGRAGEDTDNAKYYSQQAAKSAQSIFGVEERVSSDLDESTANLSEIRTLAEQVSENKESVDISEANARTYMDNAKTSETNAKVSETNAKASETNAKVSETNAKTSETNAKASEDNIKGCEDTCAEYAKAARSFAIGDTDYREGEAVDNAKYYYQQTKQISEGIGGALLPMGTVLFSELAVQSKVSGYMFNISDEFISDDTFKDGGGITYPPGTNVYYTADGYWDCLAGSLVSGIKGDAETDYRSGFVNITPEDVGTYSRDEVDQLIDGLNTIILKLNENIVSLVERIQELEDNSGYAHLTDSTGDELTTNNNEVILLSV